MKVRILRAPPSRVLEGVDLGPQPFEKGRIYDLEPRVAKVLVVWDYAERIGESDLSNAPRRQFT